MVDGHLEIPSSKHIAQFVDGEETTLLLVGDIYEEDDMISDEEAKAVQEVAKTAQRALDSGEKAGSYIAKAFQEAIGHLAEAASDSAEGLKLRNRVSVIRKTRAHFERLGFQPDYTSISNRNAIPLIEAISSETEENLQNLWASYVANALNPNKPHISINRVLVEVIHRLEPEDYRILKRVFDIDIEQPRREPVELKASSFDLDDKSLNYCLVRMSALGLFMIDNGSDALGVAGDARRLIPCRLEIETTMGTFFATPVLLLLQQSVEGEQS